MNECDNDLVDLHFVLRPYVNVSETMQKAAAQPLNEAQTA